MERCWPYPSKELDDWMKQELRKQGFRSRPGRPEERNEYFRVLWYWWHPERIKGEWHE